MQDEGGHGLGELAALLHDPEAQGDDLCGEEEVDDLLFIGLDQCSDDAQAGEAEVLEGTGLRDRVQERVQIQRDVGQEEGGARVGVGRHALQQGQCIAHSVKERERKDYTYRLID